MKRNWVLESLYDTRDYIVFSLCKVYSLGNNKNTVATVFIRGEEEEKRKGEIFSLSQIL